MKKYIAISAAFAAVLGLSGCIKETLPTDSVLSSQISQSASALDGMVNSIYTNMVGYYNDDGGVETISYGALINQLEHGTTFMACTGAGGYNTMGAWTQGQVTATNRGKMPFYAYYGYIKTVNDIIGIIDPETSPASAMTTLGICHAFRALYYNELVQVMEYKYPTDTRYEFTLPASTVTNLGVPIVTEKTTNEQAANNPRATVDEVYDLVLSDLAEAEKYLASYTRDNKTQPNLAVVYGLYARVYSALACRTETSEKYKDKAAYWQNVLKYSDLAIANAGCTPLTKEQWLDPKKGFNDMNSQNSWMLATHIDPNNTEATLGEAHGSSFTYAMIMGTETNFSVYGWRVGRSLDRAAYERLSDTDWRKKSWLGPEFFYKSTNQVEGQPYLVEKDATGKFINNKWNLVGNNKSGEITDWSTDQDTDYQLSSNAAWIRSRMIDGNGFVAWPYLYVNIKFRPANGVYDDRGVGAATDFPVMRIEEMYFLKAEAELNTAGPAAAKATLEGLIKTRDASYTCKASSKVDVYEELMFQKGIEFWGEGINYFDAKRLELGIHRGYKGSSVSRANYYQDLNDINVGWTPVFPTAEVNGNKAIKLYDNAYTNYTVYTTAIHTNAELAADYGAPIDLSTHKFFDTKKMQ